jgi:hypothetical protein
MPEMKTTSGSDFDNKTFAIGVLTVTATVLFVGFLLVSQRPAQAFAQLDKGGDYKMLTQQVSRSEELVVVTDAAAQKTIFYRFDYGNKRLEIFTGIPLDQMRSTASPQPDDQGDRAGGNRGGNRRRP